LLDLQRVLREEHLRHTATSLDPPEAQVIEEAADAYVGYLVEAYGFERADVELPPAYRGRELDWFGHVNELITALEGYSEPEVRQILTGRSPWVDGGGSLLGELRAGGFEHVRRVLKRY
jgi:hypothetical protein